MLVEEFLFGEDNLGHGTGFVNYSKKKKKKKVVKKVASKRQGGFLLLSCQVLQFKCEKDCFLQVKETAQFSYMTWRE